MDGPDTYLVSVSEDYDDFPEIETEDKVRTKKIIQSAARSLDDFLKRGLTKEARCIEDLVSAEKSVLSSVLGKFYLGVRKENGELYAKPSLKIFKFGLHKYFLKIRADDIIKDADFKDCNKIFQKVLATLPDLSGNQPSSIPIIPADIDKLYSSPFFEKETPQGLQNRVFFEFAYYFGKTERNYLRSMQKSHIQFKCDDMGNRYAELNRINQIDEKLTVSDAVIFEIPGDERCPLRTLEKYINLLNPNSEDLWQRPKDYLKSYRQNVWYDCQSLGKNALGSMMGMLSKKAGLSQVYANKCIRTTSIDNLKRNGMLYHDIMAYVSERCYNSPKRLKDDQRSQMAYILHQSLKQLHPIPGSGPNIDLSKNIKIEPQNFDYEAASVASSCDRRENLPACRSIIIQQNEGQSIQQANNTHPTSQVQNMPQQIIVFGNPPADQRQLNHQRVNSTTTVYGKTTGNLNPSQGIASQFIKIIPKGQVYSGHATQEVSNFNFQGQGQIGQPNLLPNTISAVVFDPRSQDGNTTRDVKSQTSSVPGQKKIVIVPKSKSQTGQQRNFLLNLISPEMSSSKSQEGNLPNIIKSATSPESAPKKMVILPQGQGNSEQQKISSALNQSERAHLSPPQEGCDTHIETVNESGQRMLIPKPKHVPIVNLPTITVSKSQKKESKETRDKELKDALALLNNELLKMNTNPRQQEIKKAINLLKDSVQSLPKSDVTQPIIIGTTTTAFLKILPVKKQYHGSYDVSDNKEKSQGQSGNINDQGRQDNDMSDTGIQTGNVCCQGDISGNRVENMDTDVTDQEPDMSETRLNCENGDFLKNPQNFIKALPPGGYLSSKMFALQVPGTHGNKNSEILFQAAPKGIQPFILKNQEEGSSCITETPVFLQVIQKMPPENSASSPESSVSKSEDNRSGMTSKCNLNLQTTQSAESCSVTLNHTDTSSNVVSTKFQMSNNSCVIDTHSQISNSYSVIDTHSQISNSYSVIDTHSQISNSYSVGNTNSQISNNIKITNTNSQISNNPSVINTNSQISDSSRVPISNSQLLQIVPQATFQTYPTNAALPNHNTVVNLNPIQQNGITDSSIPRFLIQAQHMAQTNFGDINNRSEKIKILVPAVNQQIVETSSGNNKRKINDLNENSSKKNCKEEDTYKRFCQNNEAVEIKTEITGEDYGNPNNRNIVHASTIQESSPVKVSPGGTDFDTGTSHDEVNRHSDSKSNECNDSYDDLCESDEFDDCTIEIDIDDCDDEILISSNVVTDEMPPANECFTCGVCNMMFPSSQQCINHCMTHSVNDKKN